MSMKFLITLSIAILVLYTGSCVVPVLFNNFEFQDDVRQAALFGAYHQQSEDQISSSLQREAHTLGLPVDENQIQVYRTDAGLVVEVNFIVQVPLVLYPLQLHFRDHSVQQTASWF